TTRRAPGKRITAFASIIFCCRRRRPIACSQPASTNLRAAGKSPQTTSLSGSNSRTASRAWLARPAPSASSTYERGDAAPGTRTSPSWLIPYQVEEFGYGADRGYRGRCGGIGGRRQRLEQP